MGGPRHRCPGALLSLEDPDSAGSVWTAWATNTDHASLTGFRAFKSDYTEKN